MPNKLLKTIFALLLLTAGPVVAQDSSTVATVKFKKEAGNYLYLKAQVADREIWIATLPSVVRVAEGDQIEYSGGMVMKEFYSKAMDQTFDAVVFVNSIRNISNPDPIREKPMPEDDVHAKLRQPNDAPKAGEIKPLGGRETVATVLAQRKLLKGKFVSVRAKIMKVNNNIMGKNWVTLQDGTGSAPDNKLIVNTLERVFPGDVVTVKGRVVTDVDLGSGYQYAILLEDGTFSSRP